MFINIVVTANSALFHAFHFLYNFCHSKLMLKPFKSASFFNLLWTKFKKLFDKRIKSQVNFLLQSPVFHSCFLRMGWCHRVMIQYYEQFISEYRQTLSQSCNYTITHTSTDKSETDCSELNSSICLLQAAISNNSATIWSGLLIGFNESVRVVLELLMSFATLADNLCIYRHSMLLPKKYIQW